MKDNNGKAILCPLSLTIALFIVAGLGVYLLTSANGTALIFGSGQWGKVFAGTNFSSQVPELDRNAPEDLETAIFALG